MLAETAIHANSMSEQHDDEGTVIRPKATATAASAGSTSPAQTGAAAPSDASEDGLSLRIGTRVSEFEITQRIGEGGFSIVYLAMDHSLERIVALKEYMPSSLATRIGTTQVQPRSHRYRDTFEAGLKSFVNEAKLLAQFDHPSLVKVYRFWEANGTAYMVMPFYQGITVKEAIRALPEPPDEAWLLTLLGPLTEALLVIHAEHCYHRDIAPDNVILLANGSKPLLLDFGAARRVIGDMTQALTVILKAGYAPVEQYAEIPGMKQGPWTDVYALAAVVYWAITGKTPPASVGRMLSDSFVPLTACASDRYSAGFLEAIDRALMVRPEQRTQSIEALRRDLGLGGEAPAGAAGSMRWDESDATVIRPIPPAQGRTITQRVATQQGLHATAQTAAPVRSTTTVTASGVTMPLQESGSRSARAESRETAAPLSTGPTPTHARRGWVGMVLALVAAIGIAAGIWHFVRKPAPTTSSAVDAAVPAEAKPLPPAASQPPAIEPPRAVETPTSPPATENAGPPADAIEPPAAAVDATTKPAVDPPVRGETSVKKQAIRRPAPAPTPAPEANQAECARIFQRLSLGESSPELLEKSRKCK